MATRKEETIYLTGLTVLGYSAAVAGQPFAAPRGMTVVDRATWELGWLAGKRAADGTKKGEVYGKV